MMKSHSLTVAVLRGLLIYDPMTGQLCWRKRGPEWFTEETRHSQAHRTNGWNAKWAGKPALNYVYQGAYRSGSVLGIQILAHRAAYAIATGIELKDIPEIDHINGDRSDNRLLNLRSVCHSENLRNTPIYKSNRTGVHGVRWEQTHRAWAVKINFDGKQRRVGRFKCFGQAILARKSAEKQHGYHPNHGRVALAIGG
jgi:hypothetical protein